MADKGELHLVGFEGEHAAKRGGLDASRHIRHGQAFAHRRLRGRRKEW